MINRFFPWETPHHIVIERCQSQGVTFCALIRNASIGSIKLTVIYSEGEGKRVEDWKIRKLENQKVRGQRAESRRLEG